jgi:cell wall-associated NlpC family hydrolase
VTSPYSNSGPQLNPYAPNEMKTLVYSPDVKIYITHKGVQYDVSADVVRGWVDRKENAASSLYFALANKPLTPGGQPRYNAGQPFAFSRMDVVTVYLKRTRMIQVFTGFLDQIPYRQLYPGVAEFRATCTLKKLLHTWWNPATPANQSLLNQHNFLGMQGGDGQFSIDSGLSGMLKEVLIRVGNWNASKVHVQNFPTQFFPFVQEYLNKNMPGYKAAEQAFETLLLGPDHSMPPKSAAGYNSTAPLGMWGIPMGGATGAGVALYLPAIMAACDARGLGPSTANIQQSTALTAAGEAGQAASDYDVPAWQQIFNQGQNQTAQENASDAAILAVACILVETGGTWMNFANPLVPESLTFPNDGVPLSPKSSAVGLFQQGDGYGIVAQRMNPYSAAGMFYDRLSQFGWRNMNPGAAIYKVQNSQSAAVYSAQITAATAIVLAYRQAQGKGVAELSTVLTGIIPEASSLTASITSAINDAINTYGVAANTGTGATPAIGAVRAGKPVPDSEGAINAAYAMLPTPYEYGGKTPGVGLDCSGLTNWAFRSIGRDIGDGTVGQKAALPAVVPSTLAQRGDLLFTTDHEHTGIYLGAGMWINTGGPPGAPGSVDPLPQPLSTMIVRRACPNGGIDPTAPFTPPTMAMPRGLPAGTGDYNGTNGAMGGITEPIARNLFSFQFMPGTWASDLSGLLPGEKQFIESQPLMQMVQALCKASLRSFQSAPNGDFIAYTPDEFGLYGKPAILTLEDIEIRDFRIDLSDEPLTTHVYVDGDYTASGQDQGINGWIMTAGVATMENEALFNQLRKVAPGDMQGMTGKDIMRKFGVRPFKQTYTMVGNPGLEFLLATQLFMGKFASMYQARVTFTFMPELYPGMRVLLRKHGLQMYCSSVTHSFDYEQGFSTQAVLSSPSDPAAAQSIEGANPLSQWSWPSDNFHTYNILPGAGSDYVTTTVAP